MKVGRAAAGCKPAHSGVRVNAHATSMGIRTRTSGLLGFRSAGRTALSFRVRQLCDWHGRTLDFEGAVFREDMVILKAGRLAVELAPQSGGSVARFTCDGVDLLRPMTAEAIASGKGNNAALYPLVPYSNRIRDGRLAFGNEIIQLARNWPGVDHPMHGDGWAHAWQVVRSDARSAEIVYQHEPAGAHGGWPFRYRARQQYRLDEASFSIRRIVRLLRRRSDISSVRAVQMP